MDRFNDVILRVVNFLNPLKAFEGYKAYITGVLMIVYAMSGLYLFRIEQAEAVQIIGTGLGIIFVRSGLKTELEKLKTKLVKKIDQQQ